MTKKFAKPTKRPWTKDQKKTFRRIFDLPKDDRTRFIKRMSKKYPNFAPNLKIYEKHYKAEDDRKRKNKSRKTGKPYCRTTIGFRAPQEIQ